MRLISQNPEMSTRQVADEVGISNGSAYYVLTALVEKGFVKLGNFKKNPRKGQYAYLLTPKGIREKSLLTHSFIELKREEFEVLRAVADVDVAWIHVVAQVLVHLANEVVEALRCRRGERRRLADDRGGVAGGFEHCRQEDHVLAGGDGPALEAVRFDPTSPTPWQNLAVLYHKQGVSTVQGLAQCASKEAAVEISRTASHALGEADNAWRKVMELVDDQRTKQETVTRLAQVLQLRGRAVAIEDPAAALPHFLEATQLLPTEPSAWEALAKVYHIVGDEVNSKKAGARLGVLRSLAPQR